MEKITSNDNLKIKHIKKLLDNKKYRRECGEYIAEGARWISDAYFHKPGLFAGIFVKESCAVKFAELLEGKENVYTVLDAVFDKISDTGHSQGILAVLRILTAKENPQSPYCLYLDSIRDPGNLGTVIRTAAAAGFNDIVLDGCADAYNPKTVRSTMSALIKANLFEQENLIPILKQNGYKILAADMNGENIFTLSQKPDKIVLIIGSEADGIRPELKSLADKTVSIPMQNTESLNAAVSAGIIMYQLNRR